MQLATNRDLWYVSGVNTPVIPPPPALPSNPVVQVSKHQAWSAAVQNIVACVCVTVAWILGKVDTTVALTVIALVVGVDFANRKRLPGSAVGAMAFGASGILSQLWKFPTIGAGVLAVLTALGAAGCAGTMPQAGQHLLQAEEYYSEALQAYGDACLPEAPKGAEAVCDGAYKLLTQLAHGLESVASEYSQFNDAIKGLGGE